MSIPVHCRRCGYRGYSRTVFVNNARNTTFQDLSEVCPGCGGWAELQSGTYDFVDNVMTAFRAPGITREKVEVVRDLVERARSGGITKNQAREATIQEVPALARIWDWIGDNDKQLIVLLTIIGLFLAHYHFASSIGVPQADQEVARRQTQALEKIGEELEKMSAHQPAAGLPAPSTRSIQTTPRAQTTGGKNRHERRKAAAMGRRKGAPLEPTQSSSDD